VSPAPAPPARGVSAGGSSPVPSPTVSTSPTTAAAAGTPAGRRGGTEAPVAFDTIKLLKVAGRKGEDVDAAIKFGGGAIAIAPKRAGDANPVTFLYRELLAATFVRERDPKWVPTLASPPADLDVPGGLFGRRPRPWLVLQGQARYVVLTLPDAEAEQILKAVAAHSRVKIDRK